MPLTMRPTGLGHGDESHSGRQTIFLGATEPRAARPKGRIRVPVSYPTDAPGALCIVFAVRPRV